MIDLNEPKQPAQKNWLFVKELSEPVNWYFNWTRTLAKEKEANLSNGIKLQKKFPSNGNLETAYTDLDRFFTSAGISLEGKYRIIIEKTNTGCCESYRLDIKTNFCRIQAGDSEGIRRAVYYLEDLLLGADGPFLPLGVIKRKPWLKSRISRCFFGPIKRPPLNRDELLDDVDYYPDEYLNRLAHEGINGLWLTIAFSDLCKTSISDLPPDAEKRLEKLRRTVEKCLLYGIKTYIFCIEPRALDMDDQMLLNNPELKGTEAWNGKFCFCPFSAVAQKYLYEATNWLFTQAPGLGGMINISYGERPTTCASTDFGKNCPICSKKTPGEIIVSALRPMERGMHDAAPDAELISWLYVPQNGTGYACDEEMLDVADKMPENVILQYNFESSGGKEQLGKYRHAGDYWLSYTGPSEIFMRLSQKNNPVSAKIQVCCSHEVATVPLVPVPGLLYRKYKAMHDLGVSHVMQCWYFGNYPGIMNKAAGELAFEDFSNTEEDFLRRLAKPEWGKYADQVIKAWTLFAEGYSNYPLHNMFQYYGPMHDGVVWPLYLKPADLPLAPTWKLEYGTSGDRYGECLGTFSLEDVLTLCAELSDKWHSGMKILRELRAEFKASKECLKDIALTETLDIQFQCGYNILKFYALRNELLAVQAGQELNLLSEMQAIVQMEIDNSAKMIALCDYDSRLGFHPEAEGYKYFPEKLAWRIKLLESLLEDEFPEISKRLNAGLKAFPISKSKSYECNSSKYEYTSSFAWKADYENEKLKVSINNFAYTENDQFKIFVETTPFSPPQCIVVQDDKHEIEISLFNDPKEVRFNILKIKKSNSNIEYSSWETFFPLPSRLVLGDYNPHAMGKLFLNNKTKEELFKSRQTKKKEIVQV
jgi:hypothetical protein